MYALWTRVSRWELFLQRMREWLTAHGTRGINSGATTTNQCHPRPICRKCLRSYDKKKGFEGKGIHLFYRNRACLQWRVSESDFGCVSGSSVCFHHLTDARFCHVSFDYFLIGLIGRDSWMNIWMIHLDKNTMFGLIWIFVFFFIKQNSVIKVQV